MNHKVLLEQVVWRILYPTISRILTAEGAKLLDVKGQLQPAIPVCPLEGDSGTGMVATNTVSFRTGNISAGTSVFGMIVLEKN
jgi:sugar (pentulose or hexulose) kinase